MPITNAMPPITNVAVSGSLISTTTHESATVSKTTVWPVVRDVHGEEEEEDEIMLLSSK